MSYVVSIWKHPTTWPLPGCLEEAMQQRRRLMRQAGPAEPLFQQLWARLQQRLPGLLPTADAPSPWLAPPPLALPEQAGARVWNLRLAEGEHLAAAQGCVVAEALALGLSLLDEQARELHRGDGVSLGVDDRAGCVVAWDLRARRQLTDAAQTLVHALARGNRLACRLLAEQVQAGLGVRQDPVLAAALTLAAHPWQRESGRLVPGDAAAREAAATLRHHLGPEGLRQAAAWLPRLLRSLDPAADPASLLAARLWPQAAATGGAEAGAAPPTAMPVKATPAAEPADVASPTRLPTTAQPQVEVMLHAAMAGDPRAQWQLGRWWQAGEAGLPADPQVALHWFRLGAEQGHPGAQCSLAQACKQGQGTPADPAAAVIWWQRAAHQGHAGAQYALGVASWQGEGTEADPPAALHWLFAAAAQGQPEALFLLGDFYAMGVSVPRHKVLGAALQRLAMRHGHAGPVAVALKSEQRAHARAWVQEWQPGQDLRPWIRRHGGGLPVHLQPVGPTGEPLDTTLPLDGLREVADTGPGAPDDAGPDTVPQGALAAADSPPTGRRGPAETTTRVFAPWQPGRPRSRPTAWWQGLRTAWSRLRGPWRRGGSRSPAG
ncbi:tetratricopeptide repeat protein [Ideonella livida]|uniref:Sel1 repeat family protein n=1 Tax=Ideonella livida TaxID=2707176 RepID=A0A7C9PJ19_9BURK|nr:tetratricopeptide repeat protein [Ideonella livida]NDY93156.1 sel1 repeat family protein [Ideonella livida]